MRFMYLILAVLLLSAVLSCERRPLVDQISNVYLDLEIEDEITNYELESLPSLMKVNFYDPDTGIANTVLEFLRYMCVLKDIPAKTGEERIRELLQTVNLTEASGKKIGALSGGMRQRLGIAQAMLSDPGILILDEPTAGLDPRERIRFRNLISKFSENRIVILATHIVSDIEYIAGHILLLHQGNMLKFDTPTRLCRELEGKVWALSVNTPDVPAELVHHTISAMAREDAGIRMRIIAPQKPHPEAVSVTANLEEVFLYHCGEEPQ